MPGINVEAIALITAPRPPRFTGRGFFLPALGVVVPIGDLFLSVGFVTFPRPARELPALSLRPANCGRRRLANRLRPEFLLEPETITILTCSGWQVSKIPKSVTSIESSFQPIDFSINVFA